MTFYVCSAKPSLQACPSDLPWKCSHEYKTFHEFLTKTCTKQDFNISKMLKLKVSVVVAPEKNEIKRVSLYTH
jgi:hypothetical protein